MSANARVGWSRTVRIGLLSGIAVAAVASVVAIGWKPDQAAAAAPAAMRPAAFLQTDKLLVTVALVNDQAKTLRGDLKVELVQPDGSVVTTAHQAVEQTDPAAAYKFELQAPKTGLDSLALHFQYGKEEKVKVPLKDVLVAKAHETSISAGQEFHAGSLASLRCGIHSVKSLSQTIPLIGDVEIRLKSADGKEQSLYKGKTNKEGVADAQFRMPAVPPGQYTLVVATKSDLAEEKLEQPIKVKTEPKIQLITDKPLYQPGQQMHIRALVLRPFDLTPQAESELVFEVEDAKGNKVFKRAQKTSAYGIASVDFQLADEVNMGDYQVRALLGQEQAQKTVTVKKYVLPKFKTEVKADKKFYMPGETVQLEVQSDYFFGKPVAQGKVKVEASSFDVAFHKFQDANGTTDANGHARFEIKLPNTFAGQPLQKGDALVKLEVKLTDAADHTETVTKTYPVSDKAIRVSLIPEAGRLVPGMENRVFAAAIYPDGSPAECEVRVWQGRVRFDAGPPNMSYKYYEGAWQMLPDFDKLQPLQTGKASGFDLSVARRQEYYGLRFEGHLRIAKDGEYTLHLTSDDGSKIWIDDKLVVENDGTHGATTVAKAVKLAKGTHRLVVGYFQWTGPTALGIEIEGAGLARQDINPHVFLTPEGNPAKARPEDLPEPLATMKTNAAGLAEFKLTPQAEQFRQGQWEQRNVEMLGGQVIAVGGQQQLFDLGVEAKDAKGGLARCQVALNGDPLGDNVLLRLDKAIYKGGDTLNAEIRTTAGLPTAYLDIVRAGQTMLTRWLDVKDGKATQTLDLPANIFGTLEIHAYQMLASGEIIRDSRVVYVHPPDDLKISVQADKDVYLPGGKGEIRFQVTDSAGKPTAAALGVVIVDEAVYALQEMQPGLEKVYFTLQEELLKPQAQAVFKPSEDLNILVREQQFAPPKQQIAQALLASIKPKMPARWEVSPAQKRWQEMDARLQQIGFALYTYASQQKPWLETKDGKAQFKADILNQLATAKMMDASLLLDPLGGKLSLDDLARTEGGFTADRLVQALTMARLQQVSHAFVNYTNNHRAKFFKDGAWVVPTDVLAEALKQQGLGNEWLKDAWGTPIRLQKRAQKPAQPQGIPQLDEYEIVSAGPDGKFDTADDVKPWSLNDWQRWQMLQWWWLADPRKGDLRQDNQARLNQRLFRLERREMMKAARGEAEFGRAGAPGLPLAAEADFAGGRNALKDDKANVGPGQGGGGAGGQPPLRVREYFPETLLWRPALITDDKGVARLPIDFADSITTWRLSASANARGGALGGVSAPLRVFQDFFVDLDLPVSLTQNDEVAFPVAVYNYLKRPQTVKLDLQQEAWFELVDSEGPIRSLDLKPNEVTSVKFRIRAKKVGFQPLTVKAAGSKVSDAIKRTIEVVPDGEKVEQVVTDRLEGPVKQVITIPDHAVPDASKIVVKVYPGVMSQVLDGMEGMMRMPCGCFEQTSSSAYPNIMVVDYIKTARLANPQMLMKAENYLNVGYQRLLTFERPGGGFDWWGREQPLVWLSAYGLHEFNDMARVYPIDRGIINRTQQFLLKKQNADGTWDQIGATHGETIERMGNPKLLLTAYVAWSLIDSGMKVEQVPQLQKSIDYLRANWKAASDNPYVLALVANALAADDAKDDRTYEVLKKLEGMKVAKPEWKAIHFPSKGMSLAYSHGDGVTVETTALAVLAMLKSGQFTNSVNQGLTYLIKVKSSGGHWGSTQATILALKAMVAGLGGSKQEGKATFKVLVNGKEAAKGEVTEANADVMQVFDLKDVTQTGANNVEIVVDGKTSLMYQIVGRYYEPWKNQPAPKPVLDVTVDYDRTELSTADILRAKATLKYQGEVPTYMVMLDLGIPPGFSVDAGDFAEMVGAKKVKKYTVTARQVTLYLGDVKPGDVLTFEYTLRPKFPIKAKTPATVAYEYNTPANRATAPPVELKVAEKK